MHVPFANIDDSLFREIVSFTPLPFFFTLSLCVSTYGEEESIDK